jgi:RHH-type proline utilization regulon transcriptional repressor/proline dehydrogenase/delta 1-pyrroline-5-carboxylate dehydrogenase
MESALRAAITAHYRADEAACVTALLPAASMPHAMRAQARALAERLVVALRAKRERGGVEGLVREYDLSSQEGVALMCLAEALLRVPDAATRDALIRDKIGGGNWRAHLGHSPSLFVNAATWGLVVTGTLVGTVAEDGLSAALTRLIARGGEPLIRKGVDLAMRMMGEQFVTGETIGEALKNARRLEAKGFCYSYDMLGEAAATAADAARYLQDYESAIHAIGAAAGGRGIYERPGISIKLSALHPHYVRAQRARVMDELLPRLAGLAVLAKQYDIGLNIDAEESERLDLSLDLLEALCFDARLQGWDGIGFVVQAYQKRAPFVLDWMIDLARRSGHRLMVRLVKGAYWDSEIKRAQVEGLEGFAVFTSKIHTDVSYLACAHKMLAAAAIFPQFATHNAYTVAAVYAMAGEKFALGAYEFQCLHGMGEPLYEEVVGASNLARPCRIYAPVGTHETLLAYLVRRLLENGANASFVNRIRNPKISVAELVADPVAALSESPISPHPAIASPRDLFAPARKNSAGLDLSNEVLLHGITAALQASAARTWRAGPDTGAARSIHNPANLDDIVGWAVDSSDVEIDEAIARAVIAAPAWATTPPAARAACLLRAADLLEARTETLLGLIIREAGKTIPNAVGEIREAVDFLRYYAADVAGWDASTPLGVVACISPWNFPLAIFVGQVAAALVAGNTVLAKPAEETPLIAAQMVALLHEAGVPAAALHLLPGEGDVGARLVADARVNGVVFTGSTEVARHIQAALAARLNEDGAPIPLIAETGGQNAMVVDSSALAEQVVADVLVSAFDSAGQRCSALRVLCLQEEIADRVLTMLKGALAELSLGDPMHLSTDMGPVISAAARDRIAAHLAAMRAAGFAVHQTDLPAGDGTFVTPAIVELPGVAALAGEVFGPVLHVVRYQRENLAALLETIAATGYGLTFGLHSRIDEVIARVTRAAPAGNVYVNRNIVGAVVGVQPFGGHGLSGTGPKAGGPLYTRRLLRAPPPAGLAAGQAPPAATEWADWLTRVGETAAAACCRAVAAATPLGTVRELPGPVGERNLYTTKPRGAVACVAADQANLLRQVGAALATGNRALIAAGALAGLPPLPASLSAWVLQDVAAPADAILFAGALPDCLALNQQMAARAGAIAPIHVARPDGTYPLEWLVREVVVSTNTAAAGGNASLLMIG